MNENSRILNAVVQRAVDVSVKNGGRLMAQPWLEEDSMEITRESGQVVARVSVTDGKIVAGVGNGGMGRSWPMLGNRITDDDIAEAGDWLWEATKNLPPA